MPEHFYGRRRRAWLGPAELNFHRGDSIMVGSKTTKGGLTIAGKAVSNSDADYLAVVKFLTVPEEKQDTPAFKGAEIAAIKALENNAFRQIADGMIASSSSYDFGDLAKAKAEFFFRKVAVDTMNRMNTGLNDADYFDPLHDVVPQIGATVLDPVAKDPHWEKGSFWAAIDLPTNRAHLANPKYWYAEFLAAQGADPTMVFDGKELPYRGECAGALQIAVNVAALAAETKAGYAKRNPLDKLLVGVWTGSNTLDFYFELDKDLSSPNYGDYIYIRNDPRYPKLAPDGFWMGLNCFYAGTDKLGVKRYSGLGVSWQSEE
ncbi:MAG: hypothetical protein HKN30_08700, partial [Sulfitobacter sp.]|nr:hypothetical protein [Sulfitobacter sp.]